jgi:long-chain acyl-CoA synthetase
VFEKVYAGALARAEAEHGLKKKIFFWALGVGKKVSKLKQARQPVSGALALQYKIADALVFSKMRAALGGRLRFAVSGGAPLSREIAEFFHAAGILILEGYGLTETCPSLTFNRAEHFKFGTVGQAQPGVELKIAPDGEILGRGPNIAKGSFKKPDATAEVFLPDGWFATGDIGVIDAEGFLTITDRKKDLIVTAGGMNIAPQNIENMLKADPFISQAMVYGDRKPYPVALITLNPEELTKFASEHGILATDPGVVVKHPKVVERIARTVEEKNSQLQSYAKIKKFTILPIDFSQDGGELTPTLKVKRKVVSSKYLGEIEELYR